jgi:hypothetical protein
MSEQIRIRCLTCLGIVEHRSERVVKGCRCDPDAPTWVYITARGEIRGLSRARWEEIE